eukprot:SAG31_NODE_22740_length_519_cov_0.683333_2_plen_52_part_01
MTTKDKTLLPLLEQHANNSKYLNSVGKIEPPKSPKDAKEFRDPDGGPDRVRT